MGDTPIERAKFALSGVGLRSRVNAAEQRALGGKPKLKTKPKTKPKTPVLRPQQKHMDARQAKIDAATAADRAAIAARNRKMSLRSK